jgi:hypothetical protein
LEAQTMLLAETLVLGDNLLAYMMLAMGGALAVGNTLAIVKPPERPKHKSDLERAPVIRSVVFAVIGALVALWAAASLLA